MATRASDTQSLAAPFRALHPAPAHAASVAAPPYDVVSADEAAALAAGKPHSFLHASRPEIDLPAGTPPHADAVYAQGAKTFAAWVEAGVLIRDPEPSFYVYRMTMDAHTQTGVAFAASVGAYERHRIRKHELTRPDKESDRVRHMQALNAQTGPVLCAYRSDAALGMLLAGATGAAPLFAVEGPNGVLHTVWRVAQPDRVRSLAAALNRLPALYIADGHHRSAAAARVAAERRLKTRLVGAASAPQPPPQPQPSHERFLTVAFPHDEMRIFDYNRSVRDLGGQSPEQLIGRLGGNFDVERSASSVRPDRPAVFGMYVAGGWYRLTLRPALVPRDDPVAALDVSLLQDHVLAPVLGIGDPRTDPRIDFIGGVRGLGELERRVQSGSAAVAFALHPTRMEQLMAVADAGKLMPPKSTWFEPKLADGLLSHVLD